MLIIESSTPVENEIFDEKDKFGAKNALRR